MTQPTLPHHRTCSQGIWKHKLVPAKSLCVYDEISFEMKAAETYILGQSTKINIILAILTL